MRRLALASLLLLGCFDWDVLSSTLSEPDLSVLDDLSVPQDLALADLSKTDQLMPDLRMPDLLPPPDLLPTPTPFAKQADAAGLAGKRANNALFGWNATNVTAVGDAGVIVATTNGTNWSVVTLGVDPGQNLNDVWFKDASTGWLVGNGPTAYVWNGTTWAPAPSAMALTNDLLGVFGSAGNKVVAAGTADAIFRFDGATWSRSAVAPKPGTEYGVWGTGSSFVSVGASNDCITITDTTQTKVSCAQAGGAVLRAAWGVSANNIVAVGYDGNTSIASKFDGANWTKLGTIPNVGKLYSVWASSATDFWAVGEGGVVLRFDGTSWTRVNPVGIPATELLRDIWGADASNIWILSSAGTIYKKG